MTDWFWLSFADAQLPTGTARSHRQETACGGVQIQYVARNQPEAVYAVLERWRDRLLTREQSTQVGTELVAAGCIPFTDKDIN